MTNGALKNYLDELFETGKLEADAHYAALYACFMTEIPLDLHRTGEYEPSAERPYAFNASSMAYQFGLNLGDDAAMTFAQFKFKTRTKRWELVGFESNMPVTPFYGEKISSKTLTGAVLTAREMWANHQKRLQAAQDENPVGEAVIQ